MGRDLVGVVGLYFVRSKSVRPIDMGADCMTDAIDRALAELRRRREQQRAASKRLESASSFEEASYKRVRAQSYTRAIDILEGEREPDTADVSVPPTGVGVYTDEITIVEATEAGHRRRTYRAAPDTPGVDARLEVARWDHDGWRPVGEEPVAQLVVNGVRAFE